MPNIEAIIFDMDGVMADTLPLHQEASHRMWANHGIDWTPELAQNIIGMRIREALNWQLSRTDLKLDLEELVREREDIYLDILGSSCPPMPGLLESLQQLQGRFKLAVASSSERASVDRVLKSFGIENVFDFVLSGSDVKKSKPHPEMYRTTAEKLGVAPENCVVVEDAEHGVISAWLAGMHVIAIPNERTQKGNFSKATRKETSLFDLPQAIEGIKVSEQPRGTVFKYKSVAEMYADDFLGENPIFPVFLNYGDWEGLYSPDKEIDFDTRVQSSANLYRRLLNKMEVNRNHTVLEVASGTGQGGKLILNEYQPHLYYGIDFSAHQAQRSKHALDAAEFNKQHGIAQATAENIPLQNDSVDRIVSVEAIQHFESPESFLSEAYRTLKPGGKLGFCSFFMNGEGELDILAKMFPTLPLGIDKFIPITTIQQWLVNAGFKNVHIEPRGKYVWEPLVSWCHQVQPDQDWSDHWTIAYKMGMIDYYHVFADKE